MAAKELILDFSEYDLDHVIADVEEIRRYNLQRFEMEQLSAVVFADPERAICAGYKDVTNDDFWVRGHMPGIPLMPGVVMCEAAAQLSSYFAQKYDLLGCPVVGLGGLEEVAVSRCRRAGRSVGRRRAAAQGSPRRGDSLPLSRLRSPGDGGRRQDHGRLPPHRSFQQSRSSREVLAVLRRIMLFGSGRERL